MAEPASGVEAYVLEWAGKSAPARSKYSVVLWRNGEQIKENVDPRPMFGKTDSVSVPGWRKVNGGLEWNLDPIKEAAEKGKIMVGDQPRVIFCDERPDWKMTSPSEWLARQPMPQEKSNAVVPAMGK
jgi:hypothetical protein